VLVVEDGRFVAARAAGAGRLVDPRPDAVGEIQAVFTQHPHIGPVLPAVGYSPAQITALAATIDKVGADVVVAATPVDLARILTVRTPIVRARYEYEDTTEPGLADLVDRWLASRR
jgi:predicted GTPase